MRTQVLIAAGTLGLIGFAHAQGEAAPTTAGLPAATVKQTLETLGGATSITLKAEAMAPRAVLESVFQQAGVAVDKNAWMGSSRDGTITADIKQLPFWDALRTLSRSGKVAAQEAGSSSDETALIPASYTPPLRGPAVSVAPFLIVFNGLSRETKTGVALDDTGAVTTATSGRLENSDQLNLRMQAYIDPKLTIAPGSGRFTITEIVDENGKSLGRFEGVRTVNTRASYILPLTVSLDPKGITGKKIARLKGTFSVAYVVKSRLWEIPNALEARNVDFEGTPGAKFVELKKTANGYSAQLGFDTAIGNEGFSSGGPTDFYARRTRLKIGEKTVPGRLSMSRGEAVGAPEKPLKHFDSTLVFNLRGNQPGAVDGPVTFAWDIPTEFARVEVPFEFTNLPLP